MGKKDKKKGKGAEKTAMKTEKKALARMKKELAAKGEDDIEKLIAKSQRQGGSKHGEEPCQQPGPRSAFTLNPHPDKEELILFGGEYYTGRKTTVYNDLYFYNIKKGTWSLLHTPLKPPPRCAHQAVVVSQNGGQLWIFGGEFVNPSRTVFYHYKDLWVFHLAYKRWELIKAPDGPSARSGHRMVVRKKQIVVFGGFHETFENYTYLNDLYVFNLETYTWSKIEPKGKIPSLRSASLLAPLTDGRILLYGGYYRQKVKKGVDKGSEFTDMYHLTVDERRDPHKWKWVQVKPSGIPPTARTGSSIAVAPNNRAYVFGGVHDDEDEENLFSLFHNDLYALELDTGRWFPITLRGKRSRGGRKRHKKTRNAAAAAGSSDDDDESEEVVETLKKTTLHDVDEITTVSDDVFTVKVLPGPSNSAVSSTSTVTVSTTSEAFLPKCRMGAILAVKNGILYLYGGFYEKENRRYTLSDFYSLDIHKLDEWRTIVPFSISNLEWEESSESENEESNEEDDDDDDDEEEEEEDEFDDDDDSDEMDTD